MLDNHILNLGENINLDNITHFTCPICGKRSLISECETFEQKDKTLRKDKKVMSGALGKQYIQTTEVYSAYHIRQCKRCAKRMKMKFYISGLTFLLIIPAIWGFIQAIWGSFFGAMFLGFFVFAISCYFIMPSVDINDARKKNAIEPPKYF